MLCYHTKRQRTKENEVGGGESGREMRKKSSKGEKATGSALALNRKQKKGVYQTIKR
jgi:hypothetical protein